MRFQPLLATPSHVGFARLAPAVHAYRSNERSAVKRFSAGTAPAWVAKPVIIALTLTDENVTGRPPPSLTTTCWPWTGAPVSPQFVLSVSSIRSPWNCPSPVAAAPCDCEAQLVGNRIV